MFIPTNEELLRMLRQLGEMTDDKTSNHNIK